MENRRSCLCIIRGDGKAEPLSGGEEEEGRKEEVVKERDWEENN